MERRESIGIAGITIAGAAGTTDQHRLKVSININETNDDRNSDNLWDIASYPDTRQNKHINQI